LNRKRFGLSWTNRHGFGDVPFGVLIGNAGSEITEYARNVGAGLIVIPSHGRGPIRRLLLGSTTDRVVHLAHCPILVLKDEKKNAESRIQNAEMS
jgi:nucleotide-binding universal stress UspA family protein